jgi:DNA-directed RNA polymerase subunit RPC12/RpoP
MLRTKCIWCGKNVRGGDDWAGRSGKCPNCGAEIIFPQIGPLRTEPEPAKPLQLIDEEALWKASGPEAIYAAAMCGVSAWIWVRLIIVLAFGIRAYWLGLRVESGGKISGIVLNNGSQLNFFWYAVFATGFLASWMLLVNGANYLVAWSKQKGWANFLIYLAGVAAWGSLMWQLLQPTRRRLIGGNSSPGWQLIRIAFAVLLMAGLTTWRRWLPVVKSWVDEKTRGGGMPS